jgi:hypothetical protein
MLWDRAVDFWLILSPKEHQIAFLGSKAKKAKTHPQTKPYIYIYSGFLRKNGFQGSLYLSRESLGNSIFAFFLKSKRRTIL